MRTKEGEVLVPSYFRGDLSYVLVVLHYREGFHLVSPHL